jgi:hypothetical protein
MLNAKAVRRHDGSRVHLEHPGGGLPCTPCDIRLVSTIVTERDFVVESDFVVVVSKAISLPEKADTRHKIHSVYPAAH